MFRFVTLSLEWIGYAVQWLFWLLTSAMPRAWKWIAGQAKADGSLGSARFADDKMLAEAGRLTPGGMLAMCTKSLKRVYCHPEASLLTIGQKGLGKTQSMIALVRGVANIPPTIVNVNGAKVGKKVLPSLLVYDPKTGVLNATRATLEAQGYRVMVIDIRDPQQSDYLYDPLSILDTSDVFDYPRQLDALARLIAPEAVHGKHDHFDSYPRTMIAGVIAHLLSKGKHSLPQCIEKLIVSKIERDKLFKEMSRSTDPIIQGASEAFEAAGDREKGSFITTNFDKMKFWLRPSVRWITEGGDKAKLAWKWEDVFDSPEPVAVFIIGGLGTGEGDLVRLIVGNAINSARRRFNKTGKPLKTPLWLLIDECKTLGNCDAVMHVNRELREARVNLAMWWLTYEDGKKTYPDWSTLLSGCDKIVYGDSGDMEWYGLIEKLLSKTTVQTRGESESDHSKGHSRHEAARNLKDAGELAELRFEQCIGIFRSKNGVMKVEGVKPFYIKNNSVGFY